MMDFDSYDLAQSREEKKLPVCYICGQRIQDIQFYAVDDQFCCESHVDKVFISDWLDEYYEPEEV